MARKNRRMAPPAGAFTSTRRRRDFALLCPAVNHDSDENRARTLDAVEQLSGARQAMGLLNRQTPDRDLIDAIERDLKEGLSRLFEALFRTKPRRPATA